MKRKIKCRFINLAETLAMQNDTVIRSMDSLLEYVSQEENSESETAGDAKPHSIRPVGLTMSRPNRQPAPCDQPLCER